MTEYFLFSGQHSYPDDAMLDVVLMLALLALVIVTQVARQPGRHPSLWAAILLLAIAATTSFLFVR